MTQTQNKTDLRLFGVPSVVPGTGQVAVSGDDTTPGFLEDKIVAGDNVNIVVIGVGAEQLEISAEVPLIVEEATGNITITNEDIVKNVSSGAITVDLPALASAEPKPITIYGGRITGDTPPALTGGQITIQADGTENIEGANTLVIAGDNSVTIFPFTDEWNII